jgi:ferritin
MLKEKVQKALNDQMNFEIYSAYIYFAMAAWAEEKLFSGFANWLRVQAGEEFFDHAAKFQKLITDCDGHVEFAKIDKPPHTWKSFVAVFEMAYNHERVVTDRINKLYDLAVTEDDKTTQQFLLWFIEEQVEEEKITRDLLAKLTLLKEQPQALFMMDQELAARKFTKD